MAVLSLQSGEVPDTETNVFELIANFGYQPTASVEEDNYNFVRWHGIK